MMQWVEAIAGWLRPLYDAIRRFYVVIHFRDARNESASRSAATA
jgi:hypothetical protein